MDPNGEPDDIGADLERNWDSQESSGDTSTSTAESVETPSASAPTAAASNPSPPSEATGVDAGRARGPDGKFVKTEKAAPTGAPAPNAAPAAPAEFKVPDTWPADVRAQLQAMYGANPQHAQFVLDQYAKMRQIAAQHHAKAQEHLKAYDAYLAPGRQARALRGVDDATHIRQVLAGDDFINKNPEAGIRWLAQQHGIDLARLANPQAQGEQVEIPAYAREIREQQQKIVNHLMGQSREQEQAELARVGNYLHQVAEATDAQGNKVYPYFDEVINEIIVAVQHQQANGQQPDVPAAYRTAVRLNDAVWLKVQTAEKEAARKAAETQRLKDIEDAKRAGFSASGSGADTRDQPPEDIGKALERNWERLSTRS